MDKLGEIIFGFFAASVAILIACGALCLTVVFVISTYRFVADGPLESTKCSETFMGRCIEWRSIP